MSHSIEDWRKANAHPKQLPLPSLLSKLNILPQPERLPAPDDSALDTRSESSVDGGSSYSASLLQPLPPPTVPLTSPALKAQQRLVTSPNPSTGSASQHHLSKANPLSPGRRASMVSHSPVGGSPTRGGVATLELGGRGPGMSRLTIVRAPSGGAASRERSGSSSHGSDGGHRRRSSSGAAPQAMLSPMTSSSPSLGTSPGGRLSFAFSTFGGASSSSTPSVLPGTPPNESTGTSSTLHHSNTFPRRASHHSHSHSAGHAYVGREEAKELTPREVVDLARETAQVNHDAGGSSVSVAGGAQEMEPVEFVPMEDEVLLPFDDRPEEVKGLLESNRSLFKLIELNFHNQDSATSSSSTPWKSKPDPSTWTYADLALVLGTADRTELPDAQWARLIRKALKPRSEPLWEKLKGCLGIDEDDEDEDGEVHLVGESLPEGTISLGYGGGEEDAEGRRIFIEGLVEGEGVPLSEENLLGEAAGGPRVGGGSASDQGGRSSDDGVGPIAGNFSPESSGDGGLPSLAYLAGGGGRGDGTALGLGMESIGEAAEDESPPPSRQTSTDDEKTMQASMASFNINPMIRTTAATPDADSTPRSSFSFHGTTKTPTPSSPVTSPVAASRVLPPLTTTSISSPLGRTRSLLRGNPSPKTAPTPTSDSPASASPERTTTPSGSSHALNPPPSPSSSQKSTRSKSFVGISILSSSPNIQIQTNPHHAPPLSPSLGLGGSSYTPSLDDASYGGRSIQGGDPRYERGPGSPLFPSSFASLSLGNGGVLGLGGAGGGSFGGRRRKMSQSSSNSQSGLSSSQGRA